MLYWAFLLFFGGSSRTMFGPTFVASSAQAQGASAPTVAVPAYPDTASGLEKLAGDILRAGKNGDAATFSALISSLSQPVTAEWFEGTFGDDGDTMFTEYPGSGPRMAGALQGFFAKLREEKVSQFTAHKHEASCDDDSGESIYPVMTIRQSNVPLYELRFRKDSGFYRLWALAYVNGGFRWVGDLRPAGFRGPSKKPANGGDKSEDSSKPDEERIPMGGTVVAGKLVHRVQPEYPEKARREHLQGTVRFHAIIAKDGTIRELRVLTGYCSLAEAAIKAVRQWRYTPTLLGGHPVEIDTTIDVIFSLNG
jgi:TonB family protein